MVTRILVGPDGHAQAVDDDVCGGGPHSRGCPHGARRVGGPFPGGRGGAGGAHGEMTRGDPGGDMGGGGLVWNLCSDGITGPDFATSVDGGLTVRAAQLPAHRRPRPTASRGWPGGAAGRGGGRAPAAGRSLVGCVRRRRRVGAAPSYPRALAVVVEFIEAES